MAAEPDILIREVGLRDGLQAVSEVVSTDNKVAWIESEAACGVRSIEACSFVPPKYFPQFADAAELVRRVRDLPETTVSALVPNVRGAEMALDAGVDVVGFVLSVSESHNRRNVRCSREESLGRFRDIAALRASRPEWRSKRLLAGLSTAFGCTIEGRIDPSETVRLAERLFEAGADQVSVADTVGYADPKSVSAVFRSIRRAVGDVPLAAHFHDTRGLGLVNVFAALETGVKEFDASLGGLGGCPYAPGATGNIATEDLVFMIEAMGLRTGVHIERLLEVRDFVESLLPHEPLHGAIARAGLPIGFENPAARRQEKTVHPGRIGVG